MEIRSRGPLPFIILASTGFDVRDCINCEFCNQASKDSGIGFNDIMQAAARDDLDVLTNPILWNCDSILESNPICVNGIDIPSVIFALREEAEIRGFKP